MTTAVVIYFFRCFSCSESPQLELYKQPHKVTFTLLMDMPYTDENVNLTINTLLTQQPQYIIEG
jgi:hypothetical protein